MDPLRVRFAPSPTGTLHIGGARTAFYNWLLARSTGGQFILRVENTDESRNRPELVEQITDALGWLGLDWDEGPFFQSERGELYRAALDRLIESGHAYYSSATSDEVREWKKTRPQTAQGYRGEAADSGAIRLRIPEGETVYEDAVLGEVSFQNAALDDFVIARADGSPTFLLTNTVDDADMRINLVCRGVDHTSNVPKQIQLFRALGVEPPRFAHVPLLHGPDGKKLSKRHGAASVQDLRDRGGYLPEAVLNYIALLGWGHGDETKMSMETMLEHFRIENVGVSKVTFDEKKLRHLNGEYMRELPSDEYADRFGEYLATRGRAVASMLQEKAQTFADSAAYIQYLWAAPVAYDPKGWKKWMDSPMVGIALDHALLQLKKLDDWTHDEIETVLDRTMQETQITMKALYQGLRMAITGTPVSAGIVETMAALDQLDAVGRIERALALMAQDD